MATAKQNPTPAAPAPEVAAAPAAAAPDAGPVPFKPVVVRQVTMPLWKLRAGAEIFVKITGAMYLSKPLKKQSEADKKKEPPTLIPAVKLDTGEVGQFIAGSVLRDIFADEYPKDAYVGKGFWIKVEEQKDSKEGGGRRYNNYTVTEIAVPK